MGSNGKEYLTQRRKDAKKAKENRHFEAGDSRARSLTPFPPFSPVQYLDLHAGNL
jgi:hypothetical protein